MIDEGIFRNLVGQVEQAKRAYYEAKDQFWAIANKVADGRPASDETGLLRVAAVHENLALDAYLRAMTALNKYLLYGAIPDEIREKLQRSDEQAPDSGDVPNEQG